MKQPSQTRCPLSTTVLAGTVLAALLACQGAAAQISLSTNGRLVVRAAGSVLQGVWPRMEVRVAGRVVGAVNVASATPADYSFMLPTALRAGAKVDIAFTNDGYANGVDRNLYISYVSASGLTVLPTATGAVIDIGSGAAAYDGVNLQTAQGTLSSNSALRLTWPAAISPGAGTAAQRAAASRFLVQASFGPTAAEIDKLVASTPAAWINAQMALPANADYVNHVQAKYSLGDAYRPGGAEYSDVRVTERFWKLAATAPDQLRKRVGFALHHILMASQNDSNLYSHSRAYANYLDTLDKHAFGNFRTLLEEMALSPVMGIYLSHMRNRKEDPSTGRMPDENFAREIMQLFTIGLVELNANGTPRLDGNGRTIETYTNADVVALAKVFTGWSWGFPDAQLTESNFRWGWPDYSAAKDTRIDLQRMKAYPGQRSTAEVSLFAGKPWALVIPANSTPAVALRMALDTLFNHPNVGPFIGRQLIQQLVTSDPSPAYVARVAAAFANNGAGVRGDLAAVVRAVLLDTEARTTPVAGATTGKLREPILRIAHAMRALGATSPSGEYMIAWEMESLSQQATHSPSVFGWFRPGYVPPGTSFAARGATAPEFQIVNESTTASWINQVEALCSWGIGWNGLSADVTIPFTPQVAMVTAGNLAALIEHLNVLLFAGRMSNALRLDLMDAVGSVGGTDAASHLNRARMAAYVAMTSPEFLAQR
jgi:uncharacterized protein (DUF1800 family)